MLDENDDSDDLSDPSYSEPIDRAIEAGFGGDADTVDVRRSWITLREPEGHPAPIVLVGRPDESHPKTIKRYDVVGELARGGVGSVLKAHDRDLGRDVAVKVLLEKHRDNRDMVQRFLEEAQIAGQLQHPGVVPVHEIGALSDDRPYFAMKLVKGQTLAELLDSRVSPTDSRSRLLGIFEQVAETLAYAHARGVIHRDLKPSNIMVGPFGEVLVMDWGLAKVLAKGGAADDARTTRRFDYVDAIRTVRSDAGSDSIAGSVMGTPAYMPPEQARGAVDDLDERSDVFGLGAILCEILTGKPPYVGEGLEATYTAARGAQLDDAFQRVKASEVEPEMISIALACLQPDAKDRPRNASVVSNRLKLHVESLDRRAEKHRDRAARFKVQMSIAILALALAVLGGGGFFVFDRARDEAREALSITIGERVGRSRVLREQAKASRDLSLWDAALGECQAAVDLAGESVGEDLIALRTELQQQLKDQRTIADLERLREERENDSDELEFQFRSAFLAYGIDPEKDGTEEAAEKVRDSAIRQDLILALDQWAVTTNQFGRSRRANSSLLDVAQAADDDPWRRRLREAVRGRAGDQRGFGRGARSEHLESLRQLVTEAESLVLAPSTLEVLAFALAGSRAQDEEQRVWRRAQELYPDNFWINIRLGDFIRRGKEPSQALQYVRAAFAIRPDSSYAAYKLGSVLGDTGHYSEALAFLWRAVSLDDQDHYLSRAARIVREHQDEIPVIDLELLEQKAGGLERMSDARSILQAELLLALGRVPDAIVLLESAAPPEAGRFSGSWGRRGDPTYSDVLDRMRNLAAPDLVSFASIDWAFSASDASARIEAFRSAKPDSSTIALDVRLAYLGGRQSQAAGRHADAVALFAEVLSRESRYPEPALLQARSLRALSKFSEAEQVLREVHRLGPSPGSTRCWKLWVRTVFVDLARSENEVRSVLSDRADGFGGHFVWLLDRLHNREPIRINCGGSSIIVDDRDEWMGDRFFETGRAWSWGGSSRGRLPREINNLHSTRRSFFDLKSRDVLAYEIPLPVGSYSVRIHFTGGNSFWRTGSERSQGVKIESVSHRIEDAAANGQLEVKDGFLSIHVRSGRGEPSMVGIEVLRVPQAERN